MNTVHIFIRWEELWGESEEMSVEEMEELSLGCGIKAAGIVITTNRNAQTEVELSVAQVG